MDMMITLQWSIQIDTDRANAEEIAQIVEQRLDEAKYPVGQAILEAYQQQIVHTLCTPSGSSAKQGLGGHAVKGEPARACPYRSFRKAGFWTEDRQLRTRGGTLRFRPALVECRRCGKRLTPVLAGLTLAAYQRSTVQLQQQVVEAVLDSSYRRAVATRGLSVSKSTAQRWVLGTAMPAPPGTALPFLGADGMKFKHQGGTRGEVRLVVQMGRKGRIQPLEVRAGVPWEQIARQVQRRLVRRASQLLSDGEPAIERWLGPLAVRPGRCQWHLRRDSRYTLWADHVSQEERRQIRRRLNAILRIEPPAEDGKPIRPTEKRRLRRQIDAARQNLQALHEELVQKGYAKTAAYLDHAQDRLFGHLNLWLQTGRLGLKTTSTIESMIRELARRLKKIGWNWSDGGATRLAGMVLQYRYEPQVWRRYWRKRMGLQGRCRMSLVRCERQAA